MTFCRVTSTALLVIFYFVKDILGQQSFEKEPSYNEVNPRSNASLACSISNLGGDCRWQKDGKPVGLFRGKYEWSGDRRAGDCGLNVYNVSLDFDDGVWQCQVTASTLASQDALVSQPARLVVRVPPRTVSIVYQKTAHNIGDVITMVEEKEEEVSCVTRFSNPAPLIQWFLGDAQLPNTTQTNASELEEPRKWRSESRLRHKFVKEDLGRRLRCVVQHEAYRYKQDDTHVSIDVLYKPVVRISRVAGGVLEEGAGSLTLTCESDSNPPARVMWTRYRGAAGPQYVESLQFNPVKREDAGTYICQAENSIGLSQEEVADIDVLFSPKILSVTPAGGTLVTVHNKTVLSCSAEGNPPPEYQWLQTTPSKELQVQRRGYTADLIIEDVMYEHQGEYVCEAVNKIGGERRAAQSEPVKIEVAGAPQVAKAAVGQVTVTSGGDAELEVEFCSDPLPQKNTWEWGSVVLPAGSQLHSRYLAQELETHPQHEDCYLSRLTLRGVGPDDSRRYFLNVENKHGTDRFPVLLTVKDPVSMASVIIVVILLLMMFVVLVVVLLYSYKKQKLCFREPSTNQSEKESSRVVPEQILSSKRDNYETDFAPPVTGYYSNGPLDQEKAWREPLENGEKGWRGVPSNPYQMYIQPYPSSMSDACSFHSMRSNQQLYNQLQFPVTSNYGSMKKKKKKPVVTVNGHNLSQELDSQGLGRSQSLGDLQSSQVSLVPGHNSSQVSLVPDSQAAVMYLPELVSLAKPNTKV